MRPEEYLGDATLEKMKQSKWYALARFIDQLLYDGRTELRDEKNKPRRPRAIPMARNKRVPGPVVPLKAYERIGYQCARCDVIFMSINGPEIFCEHCFATLEKRAGLHKSADSNNKE